MARVRIWQVITGAIGGLGFVTLLMQGPTYDPVTIAVRSGRADRVKAALREGGPSSTTSPAWSAIHEAISQGRSDLVELLLVANQDPNVPGGRQAGPPLSLAAQQGDVVSMRFLLAHGANPTLQDRVGRSPLMFAAQGGSRAAVELLLEVGVDINGRQGAALETAAKFQQRSLVEFLLERGAVPADSGAVYLIEETTGRDYKGPVGLGQVR